MVAEIGVGVSAPGARPNKSPATKSPPQIGGGSFAKARPQLCTIPRLEKEGAAFQRRGGYEAGTPNAYSVNSFFLS